MACGKHDQLIDRFGRRISYVRMSVTDRCDMRCRYCMSENMVFEPRSALLTLEEQADLARQLVARGVTRIRLTGGEPLVRRGVTQLARSIGQMLGNGLDELTITTNGARLAEFSDDLWDAGIRRINVSLDTRDPDRFTHITRLGRLSDVLAGLAAAKKRGFSIKINMVALKSLNEDEIGDMLSWCCDEGFDLSLIETMPLGETGEDRRENFLPLTEVRQTLDQHFDLLPSQHRTGGPSRYMEVQGTNTRLGFISPLTQNFCESCNRIRISATGQLYMCLGHEDHVDFRAALRSDDPKALGAALDLAMGRKPERHNFDLGQAATQRHMNVTGG
jgi:GTP 3',8-cyclase